MKQRMYNTFSRIFKNHAIAKVLSEVGYALLMAYYMVARNFVKSRKKIMGISALLTFLYTKCRGPPVTQIV